MRTLLNGEIAVACPRCKAPTIAKWTATFDPFMTAERNPGHFLAYHDWANEGDRCPRSNTRISTTEIEENPVSQDEPTPGLLGLDD